tara:strand:+ start:260 stop:712 length:453 start_codon:yes stop_codon:yes gene_type:complete
MDKINIAIGSDHAGFELKQFLIENLDERLHFEDFGTNNQDSCDFPDFATKVCKFILDNENYKGVLICGSGVGMSIAANKIEGIRASNVKDIETAIQSVEHNNVNVLCLGAGNISKDLSIELVNSFVNSSFLEKESYIRRVGKITDLEDSN